MLYIEPLEDNDRLEVMFKNFGLPVFEHPYIFYHSLTLCDTISKKLKKQIQFELDQLNVRGISEEPDFSEYSSLYRKLSQDDIIKFAYSYCETYIPKQLKAYFIRSEKENVFTEGIKEYIRFAVSMRYAFEDCLRNANRYKGFNDFIRMMTPTNSRDNLEDKEYDFYRDRFSSFVKYNHRYLKQYEAEYRKKPYKYQQHYIFYVLKKFEKYPCAGKPGNITYENIKSYYDGLIDWINQSSEERPEISHYLAERTYSIALADRISIEVSRRAELLKDVAGFKHALTLMALMPDVGNRIQYIKAFLHYETYALGKDEYGSGYGLRNLSFADNSFDLTKEWIENISRDIIKYALVFLPLLEKYTLYLLRSVNNHCYQNESDFIKRAQIRQKPHLMAKMPEISAKEQMREFEDLLFNIYKVCNLELNLMDSLGNDYTENDWEEYLENKIDEVLKEIDKHEFK